MPIPSIDISCSEIVSSSIALTCLYRWNRYRAFGTDIVRNLAEASLAFIFAVFPVQCDQIFLEAITTSGHIKLLHWAKNYHGISYQRISYFCFLLHAMFAAKLQNCVDKADR